MMTTDENLPAEDLISGPDITDIQEVIAGLPDGDRRSPEEIIGYDDHGLPGESADKCESRDHDCRPLACHELGYPRAASTPW